MKKLSIITATYNREKCLKTCWESLKKQTCKDFQWIIVDDGSTDNTKEVVKQFKLDSPDMHIDYVYKQNGGKHTAINTSYKYIQGDYSMTLDSDDRLLPNAVEQILKAWETYGKDPDVGQVIFLRGYSNEEPICYVKHEKVPLDTLKEPRISTKGRERDCNDVFKSSLFKKYPFPVFDGEKFIGEGSSFFFIQQESKGVYINKVVCVGDYRNDGLTSAGRKMRLSNPLGGRFDSKVHMSNRMPMKIRIKKGILYTCYSKIAKISFKKTISENQYKILTIFTYIPGVMLYHYWKKKYLS
ncbi:MAG: glycosyltransferase family 2 protein [Ruminococcus sp.]|nr:glycosyltransferase family 2 protein [Ruminococcus sp.]